MTKLVTKREEVPSSVLGPLNPRTADWLRGAPEGDRPQVQTGPVRRGTTYSPTFAPPSDARPVIAPKPMVSTAEEGTMTMLPFSLIAS